jgi:hydroxymethylglutaryl-CoA synthase
MAGIVSYGSYVPYRRLKRAAIAQVLGVAAVKGERAVASFDEDSVSMAVEALRDALRGAPGPEVQALAFATTTPPYAEKLNAAIVGAAAQLPAEIRAADLTGSPEGRAEQTNGDGAAAFIVGSQDVIAEIEASASVTREFLDTWRAPGERFAHTWEERFALTQAHTPMLIGVIRSLLAKTKVTVSDLSKIVIDAPNPRAIDEAARAQVGPGPDG